MQAVHQAVAQAAPRGRQPSSPEFMRSGSGISPVPGRPAPSPRPRNAVGSSRASDPANAALNGQGTEGLFCAMPFSKIY